MMLSMGVRSRQFNPRTVRAGSRRQKQQDFWQKLIPWISASIVLALLCLGAALYWPVVQKYRGLQQENREIGQRIQEEQMLTVQAQEELHSLKVDRLYIERMARDILHYGRKGEIIYKFPPYEDRSPLREAPPGPAGEDGR